MKGAKQYSKAGWTRGGTAHKNTGPEYTSKVLCVVYRVEDQGGRGMMMTIVVMRVAKETMRWHNALPFSSNSPCPSLSPSLTLLEKQGVAMEGSIPVEFN